MRTVFNLLALLLPGLPAGIARQVCGRLEPNECIEHWDVERGGFLVVVELIDRDDQAEVRENSTLRGRPNGTTGRSLHFILKGGEWVFAGEGSWIS